MRFTTLIIYLTIIALLLTVPPTPAHAFIIAPQGAAEFCLIHVDECAGGGENEINIESMSTLRRVNTLINRTMTYHADATGTDSWTVGATSGDCEDYALTKRHMLIQSGIPPNALHIALTHTRKGIAHAILLVTTNQGTYVLDNLDNAIYHLESSGYVIVAQTANNLNLWSK